MFFHNCYEKLKMFTVDFVKSGHLSYLRDAKKTLSVNAGEKPAKAKRLVWLLAFY
jgi:hypothetical protein